MGRRAWVPQGRGHWAAGSDAEAARACPETDAVTKGRDDTGQERVAMPPIILMPPPGQVLDPFLEECEAFGYQALQPHQEAVLREAQALVAALERKEAARRGAKHGSASDPGRRAGGGGGYSVGRGQAEAVASHGTCS